MSSILFKLLFKQKRLLSQLHIGHLYPWYVTQFSYWREKNHPFVFYVEQFLLYCTDSINVRLRELFLLQVQMCWRYYSEMFFPYIE